MRGKGPKQSGAIAEIVQTPHETKHWNFANARRCGARNRKGSSCQCPAMRGKKRCRLHGGKSTGPRTEAGLRRIRLANLKHGHFTKEARRERTEVRAAFRQLQALLKMGILE